ncbi:MAG: hypothetical protein AAFP19_13915 [Bacteroidota bacterium]
MENLKKFQADQANEISEVVGGRLRPRNGWVYYSNGRSEQFLNGIVVCHDMWQDTNGNGRYDPGEPMHIL